MLTITAADELSMLRYTRAGYAKKGPVFADEVARFDAKIARIEAGHFDTRTVVGYVECQALTKAIARARAAGF